MAAGVRGGAGLVLALAVLLLGAPPAAAEPLPLPRPDVVRVDDLLADVGARADRLLRSVVPGPVVNDEVVLVDLDGSGRADAVRVAQRLRLTGTGDYQVRERGPARAARALGEEPPPVTKFGAVVWQGFSPGARSLAAELVLDAALERPRLPLGVQLSFVPAGGGPARPLGPGGALPGAGTVLLDLVAQTSSPTALPTGRPSDTGALAAALDTARAAADAPLGARLPVAGGGLPAALEADGVARTRAEAGVPLRLAGTVRVLTGGVPDPDVQVRGPGTPVPGGTRLAGTLPAGTLHLELDVVRAGTLELALDAAPALDPRALVPPGGAASWADWAASGPSAQARQQATDLLVRSAAATARAAAYAPYLGADLPGTGSTVFRLALAAPEAVAPQAAPLRPRPAALALTGVALALLAATGVGLWRAS